MAFTTQTSQLEQIRELQQSLMPDHNSPLERVEWLASAYAAERRWKGASDVTIAQHICQMVQLASPKARLYAFFHEGEEGPFGDWSSPLKDIFRTLGVFDAIESALIMPVRKELSEMFGLQWPWPADVMTEIREIDLKLAATEYRDTVDHSIFPTFSSEAKPYENFMLPWSQTKARERFLEVAYEVMPWLAAHQARCA